MKKNYFSLTALAATVWPKIILAATSLQEDFNQKLDQAAGQEGLGYNTANKGDAFINTALGKFIAITLGFLGLIFFILILMAGWQWMMAGGDAKKIEAAKQRIINATIGLVIVLAAYLLTTFIYQQSTNALR